MRFYLFDKVVSFIPESEASGIKNVSAQEEFFIDHYQHLPEMPEPLIAESLAQLGGWAITVSSDYKYFAIMVMIKNFEIKGSAKPGDQIVLSIKIENFNDYGATISGKAEVDGSPIVTIGNITYVLYPIPESKIDEVKARYCRTSGGFLS
jgi:3-hydroxyacyl-[acyl-carrier-protein] dehydratase